MATQVEAAVNLIERAAQLVLKIRAGVFKASKEVTEFPQKIKQLEERRDELMELLRQYGQANDSHIQPKLNSCRDILVEVEKMVEKSKSKHKLLKLGRKLIFPEELPTAIDNLTKAIEEIPQFLKTSSETKRMLEDRVRGTRCRLPFISDRKYVPIVETVRRVRDALESHDKGAIVTLYGGSGDGKSTLAKHLAICYQDANSSNSTELASYRGHFDDGVFFLRCQQKVAGSDAKTSLFELWKMLGYEFHVEDVSIDGISNITVLRNQLHERLQHQRILIILDDVEDTQLVDQLFIQSAGIKYLITSLLRDVWLDTACVKVQMSVPSMEEARQIVANHVPSFGGKIPDHLEGEIVEIIELCERNPLTIVNVAISVDEDQSLKVGAWKLAKKNLDGDFHSGPVLFGESYSKRTTANGTAMAINSFSEDMKTILCIAALFETEAVPEPVFTLFFKTVHSTLATFSYCSKALEGSRFIQREVWESRTNAWSETTWIIHSKRQLTVRDELKGKIDSMVSKILDASGRNSNITQVHDTKQSENAGAQREGNDTGSEGEREDSVGWEGADEWRDAELLLALLFLYGREREQETAAKKLGFINYEKQISSEMRKFVQPFVFMLEANAQEEWEQQSNVFAKQIIQQYLKYGKLHHRALANLILLRDRCFQASWAMVIISNLSGDYIKFENLCGLVEGLVPRLAEHMSPNIQENTLYALSNLSSCDRENRIKMGSYMGLMEGLVALLCKNETPNIQELAAAALRNFCGGLDAIEDCIKLGACEGAIEGLVALLHKHEIPNIQKHAAAALTNLCVDVIENCITLGSCEGAMEALVALLHKHESPSIQEPAAGALTNLCKVIENRIKLGSCEGAMESLVALLCKHETPNIQKYAVGALGNLCLDVIENRIKLGSCLGAMEGLVALLCKHEAPGIQKYAAAAVTSLCSGVTENKIKLGSCEGAMKGLVDLLYKHDTPEIQECAAGALRNLCQVTENSIKLGSLEGAMEGLVVLLRKDKTPNIQENAAGALANVCCDVIENCITLGSCEGALESLVTLLYKHETPNIQEYAAAALRNCSGVNENIIKLGSCEGAMKGLVGLLGKHETPNIQEHAVGTLANLCCDVIENRIQLGSCEGAMEGLVTLLYKHDRPRLQQDETEALRENVGYLLGDILELEINRRNIKSQPNLLTKFVKIMEKELDNAENNRNFELNMQFCLAKCLTFVDYGKASNIPLKSYRAYEGRGFSKAMLGKYETALEDYNFGLGLNPESAFLHRLRSFVHAMLGDYNLALEDIDASMELEPNRAFDFQTRGIIRRMMNDLNNALLDLNRSLQLYGHADYEVLKHRGFVKFIMGDEGGAREDAERAMMIQGSKKYLMIPCLGVQIVKYLEFEL